MVGVRRSQRRDAARGSALLPAVGPLADIRTLLDCLLLTQVPHESWLALHEDSTCSLDLDLPIDHVLVEHLRALAQAVQAIGAAGYSANFWEWMSIPADRDFVEESWQESQTQSGAVALPRTKALLVVLAQAVGNNAELVGVAGCAYCSLLALEGADRLWGTLFSPTLLQHVLRAVRPLRAAVKTANLFEEADASGGEEAQSDVQSICSDMIGVWMDVSQESAAELLATLIVCLQSSHFAASAEVAALVTDELMALISCPLSAASARGAAAALGLVVSGAGCGERCAVRRAAAITLRALVPTLLMTQDHLPSSSSSVPKRLQVGRSVALDMACGIIRTHPELLLAHHGPALAADTLSDTLGDAETEENPDIETGPDGVEPSEAEENRFGRKAQRSKMRGADDPIVALLQLVCTLAPERAEWRAAAVETVLTLLRESVFVASKATAGESGHSRCSETTDGSHRQDLVVRFLAFLERLLICEKASWRALATEVAASALEQGSSLVGDGDADSAARIGLAKRLLAALVLRCKDAMPTVRSRALGGVAAALAFLSKCEEGVSLLREAVFERDCPHSVDLRSLFLSAGADDKSVVRRASLLFLENSLRILQSPLGLDTARLVCYFDLELLGRLATDETLTVRKASIATISLMHSMCPEPIVHQLWLRYLLPLVLDVEGSIVERALDEVEVVLLTPVSKRQAKPDAGGALARLPAVLLHADSEATGYLVRSLVPIAKRHQGTLPSTFTLWLGEIVTECVQQSTPVAEWPLVVWSLLEDVLMMTPKVLSPDLFLAAWGVFDKSRHKPPLLGVRILRVLSFIAQFLRGTCAEMLAESFLDALSLFTVPAAQLQVMLRLVDQLVGSLPTRGRLVDWKGALLGEIQDRLADVVHGGACVGSDVHLDRDDEHPDFIYTHIYTLGELALVDPAAISDSVIDDLRAVATNRVETSPAARAEAFASLGKLCLRREDVAKRSVELLVIHLSSSESFVVRNNVLIVLGDLCVHYTSLVDRFIPVITELLSDANELLRKQAAMTLSSLLSEDFVKFRGSIVLRLVYCLSDPSFAVRSLVECVFERILCKRNPSLFSRNFVDILCALNGWSGLPSCQLAKGNEAFSLSSFPARRTAIYRFMLASMTNEQKFQVCSQIVGTLLSAFVEGEAPIPLPQSERQAGGRALIDGLAMLSCKELRVCFSAKQAVEEAGEDCNSTQTVSAVEGHAAEAARGALSSVLKRNMCENIVPTLIQLKDLMEQLRSPFLRQLGHCLREILHEFRDDLQDVLAGDEQLALEIAADWAVSCPVKSSRLSLDRMLSVASGAPMQVTATPRSMAWVPTETMLPTSTKQQCLPRPRNVRAESPRSKGVVRKLSWCMPSSSAESRVAPPLPMEPPASVPVHRGSSRSPCGQALEGASTSGSAQSAPGIKISQRAEPSLKQREAHASMQNVQPETRHIPTPIRAGQGLLGLLERERANCSGSHTGSLISVAESTRKTCKRAAEQQNTPLHALMNHTPRQGGLLSALQNRVGCDQRNTVDPRAQARIQRHPKSARPPLVEVAAMHENAGNRLAGVHASKGLLQMISASKNSQQLHSVRS